MTSAWRSLRSRAGRVITFGTGATRAEFRAEKIEDRGVDGSAFDFVSPGGRARLELPLIGRHNVMNALAALAAASVWGIGAAEAQRVFPKLQPADKRGEVVRFEAGFAVINDCYNSNPTALAALRELLAATPGYQRRILAAGEMLRAGRLLAELHRECGRSRGDAGKIDWIIGVQGDAAEFVRAAIEAAIRSERTKFFRNSDEAAEFLAGFIAAGRSAAGQRLARRKDGKNSRCARRAATRASRSKPTPNIAAAAAEGRAEMLYYLFFYVLRPHFSPLNVFRYITVRTALASLTALLLSLLLGPWVIGGCAKCRSSSTSARKGPKRHQAKAGTPTMGGVLIVAAIVIPTLLWADLRNPYVLLAVVATLAFGAIGFIDDYNKVVRRRNLGLTARTKFSLQVLTCIGVGVVLAALQTAAAPIPRNSACRSSRIFIPTW